jgi:hypothetical protein
MKEDCKGGRAPFLVQGVDIRYPIGITMVQSTNSNGISNVNPLNQKRSSSAFAILLHLKIKIDKKSTNNEDAYLLLPAVLSATLYRRKEGDKNILHISRHLPILRFMTSIAID